MSRKRKSDSISEDDGVDLSVAYGVEEDPPSIPKPGIIGDSAISIPVSNYKNNASNYSDLGLKFHLTNAMSNATRSLDESAKLMQLQSIQNSTDINKRCTPCRYTDVDCDLQRPTCQQCQDLRTGGITVPCLYTQDVGKQAEIPYGQVSTPPVQSEPQEVEVTDLGSDNDAGPNGDSEEYEVEAILARRSKKRKGVEYLVKWKGYTAKDNTWEPVSNLEGAQVFIDGFEKAVASALKASRKKNDKRPKTDTTPELKRSPSLGLVLVPRNPKVLEYQTSRKIPDHVKSIDACRLVPPDDTYEYLVSWNGLAPKQSSWEAEDRFLGRKSLIQNYHLATCLDFPSDDTADTIDHSGTDRRLISAGVQVIVCSRRTGMGSRLTYCFYDKDQGIHLWPQASKLVSNEAQTAILLFVMRSKIMQGYLEPNKAAVFTKALNEHGIPGPSRVRDISPSQESGTQATGLTGRTPEIYAVLSHRLRTGKSTDYLIRWKHSQLDTWHPAEVVSKIPDGILATRKYVEVIQKRFVHSASPVLAATASNYCIPVESIPKETTRRTGTASVSSSTPQLRDVSHPNQYRPVYDKNSQKRPFFRCCVECKKAGLDCEGTTRCERCVTLNLTCVYAQPTTYERQAAEVWLRNQLSQHPSRESLEVKDTPPPSTEVRKPPPSAKSTSTTAWKVLGANDFEHIPRHNSIVKTSSNAPTSTGVVISMGRSRSMVNGAAAGSISNEPRRVSQPTVASQQPPSPQQTYRLNYADEKWISDHISRTMASLSPEAQAKIQAALINNQSIMQISVEQQVDPLYVFLRSRAEKELQFRKAEDERNKVSVISKGKAQDSTYANGQAGQSSTRASIQLSPIPRPSSTPQQPSVPRKLSAPQPSPISQPSSTPRQLSMPRPATVRQRMSIPQQLSIPQQPSIIPRRSSISHQPSTPQQPSITRQPSTIPHRLSTPQQSSIRKPVENNSEGTKHRNHEESKKVLAPSRKTYPREDSHLLVKKTDMWFRPLPNGPHNVHNVASNVLLTIGKHPWLPGLNHHLRGLLDRSVSGRKLNIIESQVRNAENFKGYKAPSSASEIMQANYRAILPMGGIPL